MLFSTSLVYLSRISLIAAMTFRNGPNLLPKPPTIGSTTTSTPNVKSVNIPTDIDSSPTVATRKIC